MLKREEVELYKTISRNVEHYAKKLGYTHRELSSIIGVSESAFCQKMHNSNWHFNILELMRLADEFMLQVDDLLKGE